MGLAEVVGVWPMYLGHLSGSQAAAGHLGQPC